MDALRRDLRYALRGLARGPLFAVTLVSTLGLGIGANTAIFSFVDGMLLRPLPYPDPDRLVMVWQDYGSTGGPVQEWFTPPEYADLREEASMLAAVSPLVGWTPNLTGVAEPERLTGLVVSTEYFDIVGIAPVLGRGFQASDAQGDGQVVVITHSLWQRAFGGRQDVLGQTMRLNEIPFTVIGVLPPDFRPPFLAGELFRPYLPTTFGPGCGRACYVMRVLARVRPDVSVAQASASMDAFAAALRERAPGEKLGLRIRLVPLQEQLAGPVATTLWVLLGAVGLLLLIACVNIANLLLSRAGGRQRELAVRLALGAGRRALVRQALTESVVFGLAGGVAGALVAYWGVDLLVAMSPAGTPRLEDVAVNLRTLTFTLVLAVGTGLLFGLAPALSLTGIEVGTTLRETSTRATAGRGARSALVVCEVALALVLLAGAGLLVRSFARLTAVDPGFEAERAMAFRLVLPQARYANARAGNTYYQTVLERLRARPDVEAAGATSIVPLSGANTDISIQIEGRPVPQSREQTTAANYRSVTPEYIAAAGIRLLRGRDLLDTDRADAPGVALVNETMAQRYWPGEDVLGKRFSARGPEGPWVTIVGVVSDVHHFGLDQLARPTIYTPTEQVPNAGLSVVVRTRGDATRSAASIREAIRAVDPELPVPTAVLLESLVQQSVAMPRLVAVFSGFFAAVALLLAAVGIYGVTAQTVGQRRQEIGIRIALGADARRVVAMIVAQAMRMAVLGLVIGLVAALLLTRTLQSLLFEMEPSDPMTFTAIAALLGGVALLAAWLPARRAARVQPATTLRLE